MAPVLKPRQINNSPARIAFPGWVSLAFPPAGAAAARPRGLTNVPFSCMATNLPASLLSERAPERDLWCALGARTMPVRRARRFQPLRFLPASQHRRLSRKLGPSMGDVCCPSPWQRRDATAGGRRGLGRAPSRKHGRFYESSGAERCTPVCIMMKMLQHSGLGLLLWSSHTLQPTEQKPAICCKAPSRFLWRR